MRPPAGGRQYIYIGIHPSAHTSTTSAHFQPKTGTAALAGKRSGRKRSGEDERQGWLGSSGLQLSLGGGGAGLLKTQAANEVDEMKTRAE